MTLAAILRIVVTALGAATLCTACATSRIAADAGSVGPVRDTGVLPSPDLGPSLPPSLPPDLGPSLSPDLGVVAARDSGPPSSPPDVPVPLPVADQGASASQPTGRAADWSCLGSATAPASGPEVAFRVRLLDFQLNLPYPAGTTLAVFKDNLITPGSCTGALGCQMLVADAQGFLNARGPSGGWFAYELPAQMLSTMSTQRPARTFQLNVPGPSAAGAVVEVHGVSQSTRVVIPTIAGLTVQRGTTQVFGTVRDCQRREVRGAIVSVVTPDGRRVVETGAMSAPSSFYFTNASSALPDPSQPYTNTNGLYGAANLPARAEGLLRIEAWAKTAAGSPPRLIACEAAQAIPDSVNLLELTPLRSDYPVGHPCR